MLEDTHRDSFITIAEHVETSIKLYGVLLSPLGIKKAFGRFCWPAVTDMAMELVLYEELNIKLLIEEPNQSMTVGVDCQMPEGIPRGRGGAQRRPQLPTTCRMFIGWLIQQESDPWLTNYANQLPNMNHLNQHATPA